MFANTQMTAINLAFPDVCKTLVGVATVPLPYPNIATTSLAVPTVYNQYTEAMPDHNLLTTVVLSNGDEAGLLLGLVSNLIMGSCMHILGSFKVFKSVMPATKMLSITGQNGPLANIPGVTLSPCQVKVMILS